MLVNEKMALTDIAEVLSREQSVLMIVVYGSRIRGDYRGDSDFDVFVLVDKKDTDIKDKIIETFYDYELKSGIPFSVTILSKKEFEFNESLGSPFIKSIKEEGVIIYDAQQGRKGIPLKVQA